MLPLVLLLLVQYATAAVDLALRMQQAHRRLALFMAVRNLPAVLMLAMLKVDAPLQVVLVDFVTALVVVMMMLRSRELRVPAVLKRRALRWRLDREQLTLWLARLAQFGNSSLLRVLIPLLYGGYETGLFFFALIAQLPCSLFLSVTTQLHGHTLARLQPGDWRTLWRTQAQFALPNALYAGACALLIPYWPQALGHLPSLAKYADAGVLVLAAVCYGAVLASDAQEYLLRSRGLSRVLLAYGVVSVLVQLALVLSCAHRHFPLPDTLFACAIAQAIVLTAFSTYSFKRVIGRTNPEPIS
jgi:hypothetical protein